MKGATYIVKHRKHVAELQVEAQESDDDSAKLKPASHRVSCVALSADGDYAFTGSPDSVSFVRLWHIAGPSVVFLGTLGPMIGATRSLSTSHASTVSAGDPFCPPTFEEDVLERRFLAVVTVSGNLYIWDVSTSALQGATPFSLDRPLVVHEGNESPVAAANFLQDGRTVIVAGSCPDQSFGLIDAQTGSHIGTLAPLQITLKEHHGYPRGQRTSSKEKALFWNIVSLSVDGGESTPAGTDTPGRWVAAGDAMGCLGLFFITDRLLETIKAFKGEPAQLTLQDVRAQGYRLSDMSISLRDVVFRPRSSSSQHVVVSVVATDGLVRHLDINKQRVQYSTGVVGPHQAESWFIRYDCSDRVVDGDGDHDEASSPTTALIVTASNQSGASRWLTRTTSTASKASDGGSDEPYHLRRWFHLTHRGSEGGKFDASQESVSQLLTSHPAPIVGLAASQDRTVLMSVSSDGTLCVLHWMP